MKEQWETFRREEFKCRREALQDTRAAWAEVGQGLPGWRTWVPTPLKAEVHRQALIVKHSPSHHGHMGLGMLKSKSVSQ